jgi:RNA polymerase sigma factor (TIGR02999 family)
MAEAGRSDVTSLLIDLQRGRPGALDALIPLVYAELRELAAGYLRRDGEGRTLQPTALVHEAFLRLVDQRTASWQNRAHFFGVAAQLMRRIVVDQARRRNAQKRGGGRLITLDEGLGVADAGVDVIPVDEALGALEKIDPRQARVVELRFFGGLTIEETAEVLGVSTATVKRDWLLAKAWLHRELQNDA